MAVILQSVVRAEPRPAGVRVRLRDRCRPPVGAVLTTAAVVVVASRVAGPLWFARLSALAALAVLWRVGSARDVRFRSALPMAAPLALASGLAALHPAPAPLAAPLMIGAAAAAACVAVCARLRDAGWGPSAASVASLGVGVGASSIALPAPRGITAAIFGSAYAQAGELLPHMILAGTLSASAWLIADRFSSDVVWRVSAGTLALQAGIALSAPAALSSVAGATMLGSAGFALALGAAEVLRGGQARDAQRRSRAGLRSYVARGWADPAVRCVAGLSVIGLGLRLVVERGLWVDEAISVAQARMPFGQMIESLRATDMHPPLWQVIQWVTVRLLGFSELAVRAPAIVAGTLLIPLLYVAGRDLFERRAGLVAATLGTASPFIVWYSQEARMYTLFMLLALLAIWMQVRAVRHGRGIDWTIYTLATIALLWTHYFAVLHVVVQQSAFAAVLWHRRRDPSVRRYALAWAASLAAILAAVLPLFFFAYDQRYAYSARVLSVPSRGGSTENPPVGDLSVYSVIANWIWAMWGYHSKGAMARVASLWPLGMLFVFFLLGRGRSRVSSLLLAATVLPSAALLLAGLQVRDLFEVRYFAGAVPLLLLLTAELVTHSFANRGASMLAATVVVASLVVALIDQQSSSANPRRYDFKGAITRVASESRPGDVLVYEPWYLDSVVAYYASGVPSLALKDATVPPRARARRVFLVATPTFLGSTGRGRVDRALLTLRSQRRLVDRFDRPGVEAWVFQ